MANLVKSTLVLRFKDEPHPPWIEPFLQAVEDLEPLDQKDEKEKQERRVAQRAGDDRRKRMGEIIVPVMDDEDELKEEISILEQAEGHLNRAIQISNSRDPLPYSWLSSVLARLERWHEAREATIHAVRLDPLSHSLLFHLSHCYEQEREYVKAHDYFEHAVSLLPPFQNGPYAAKLLRLKEQADDQKAHVFRGDPLEMLPLEIVISIMQEGNIDDKYFVLRNTWVNQRWRNTLIGLKELWSCLRYVGAELKDKSYDAKRATWVARAGTQLETISFEGLTTTNVSRLTKVHDAKLLKSIRTLKISVKEPLAFNKMAQKFADICEGVKHLEIDGGYDPWNGRLRRGDGPTELNCGFPFNWHSNSVKTIRLSNVDFRSLLDTHASWSFYAKPSGYYSLVRLQVDHCAFNNNYRTTTPVFPDYANPDDGIHQSDPLHFALRATDKLEYLSVTPDAKTLATALKPGIGRRKELPLLKTAILPPPSVWSIDISAPNLRTLHFVLSSQRSFDKYDFTQTPSPSVEPLIPTIADTPVALESMPKLEDLAFECNYRDDIARLEEWLSQTPSLTTLSLSGSGMPYPKKLATPENPDNRAQIRLVQLLMDHPEYVPRLTELKLEYCWATSAKLVELVKQRKASDSASTLERLTLAGCPLLTKEEYTTLTQEVPNFEYTRGMPAGKGGNTEYTAWDFRDASFQAKYSQSWL